jgi:hypothetical protein
MTKPPSRGGISEQAMGRGILGKQKHSGKGTKGGGGKEAKRGVVDRSLSKEKQMLRISMWADTLSLRTSTRGMSEWAPCVHFEIHLAPILSFPVGFEIGLRFRMGALRDFKVNGRVRALRELAHSPSDLQPVRTGRRFYSFNLLSQRGCAKAGLLRLVGPTTLTSRRYKPRVTYRSIC